MYVCVKLWEDLKIKVTPDTGNSKIPIIKYVVSINNSTHYYSNMIIFDSLGKYKSTYKIK